MNKELKHVTIYTDGACRPNPGTGGYGIVSVCGGAHKEFSGGFRQTTNNRMEIYAAIKALEMLEEPCEVNLYSDSRYLVRGWAKRWKEDDWRRNGRWCAPNHDLWEKLLDLCEKHQIEFTWVKGHDGNPENERCDKLSCIALGRNNLPIDEGYESQLKGEGVKVQAKVEVEVNQLKGKGVKTKITLEGQPCRKCLTPVVKKTPRGKIKHSQAYCFEYYLYCPKCRTMYMVKEAMRFFSNESRPQRSKV